MILSDQEIRATWRYEYSDDFFEHCRRLERAVIEKVVARLEKRMVGSTVVAYKLGLQWEVDELRAMLEGESDG